MSKTAEYSLIGSLLTDISCIRGIYGEIEPFMFESITLGAIYKEIVREYDIGEASNPVTLMQNLESENLTRDSIGEAIKYCMGSSFLSVHAPSYADDISKDYKTRRLKEIVQCAENAQTKSVNEQIGELIGELEALKGANSKSLKSMSEIVTEYQDQYFVEREANRVYTGFAKLDDITGGLEGGDVIVIGARPAVGKSAFVTQIILQMASAGKRIAFYNLEMSDKQVYERLLSNQSGIRMNRIRRAKAFLEDEKEVTERANTTLAKFKLLISSGTKTVSQIRNECRHQELDCMVIDYLQLVRPDRGYQNRTSEVGEVSKAIKALAMELDIPIIALSQLNRASERKDSREPTMAELREAGDIEQDASVIMLMWDADQDDKTKKALRVDKNRQGERGEIVYNFDGSQMMFTETEERIEHSSEGFKPAEMRTPFD